MAFPGKGMRRLRRGKKKIEGGLPYAASIPDNRARNPSSIKPPPTVFFSNRYRRRKWIWEARKSPSSGPRLRDWVTTAAAAVVRSIREASSAAVACEWPKEEKRDITEGKGKRLFLDMSGRGGRGGRGRKPAAPTGEKGPRAHHAWLVGWAVGLCCGSRWCGREWEGSLLRAEGCVGTRHKVAGLFLFLSLPRVCEGIVDQFPVSHGSRKRRGRIGRGPPYAPLVHKHSSSSSFIVHMRFLSLEMGLEEWECWKRCYKGETSFFS